MNREPKGRRDPPIHQTIKNNEKSTLSTSLEINFRMKWSVSEGVEQPPIAVFPLVIMAFCAALSYFLDHIVPFFHIHLLLIWVQPHSWRIILSEVNCSGLSTASLEFLINSSHSSLSIFVSSFCPSLILSVYTGQQWRCHKEDFAYVLWNLTCWLYKWG